MAGRPAAAYASQLKSATRTRRGQALRARSGGHLTPGLARAPGLAEVNRQAPTRRVSVSDRVGALNAVASFGLGAFRRGTCLFQRVGQGLNGFERDDTSRERDGRLGRDALELASGCKQRSHQLVGIL